MSNKANILVVEDNPLVRCAIEDVLRLNGFRVRGACNGVEALTIIEEAPPDLILADIIMPVMNGYQFYQRVRYHEHWQWIPFIFLTAKDDPGDIRYGRELGVDDYLVKPFETEDLMAAVLGKLGRFDQLSRSNTNTRPLVGDEDDMIALKTAIRLLSEREREVLMLICGGLSNARIADRLVIAHSTVKTHVANILSKLGVTNRVEAATLVMQAGLDCLDE